MNKATNLFWYWSIRSMESNPTSSKGFPHFISDFIIFVNIEVLTFSCVLNIDL